MFREGQSLDEVIDATSLSTAKRGLEDYKPEVREEVKRLIIKLGGLNDRIKETQQKYEKMEQDIVDATHEVSDKQKKVLNYEETLEALASKTKALEEELATLVGLFDGSNDKSLWVAGDGDEDVGHGYAMLVVKLEPLTVRSS